MALAAANGGVMMTATQLQGLFTPIPPLVLRYSQEILEIVKRAYQEHNDRGDDDENIHDDDELGELDDEVKATPSSAFFKPANTENQQRRRSMMSPVLGTEALYKQAGWMTPSSDQHRGNDEEEQGVMELTTTTDDDENDDDDDNDDEKDGFKPKKLLAVHSSNQGYKSKEYAEHSLELGAPTTDGVVTNRGRARSADGMGSVRAAASHDQDLKSTTQERDVETARGKAAQIQSGMVSSQKKTIPMVLGLATTKGAEEDEDDDEAERDSRKKVQAEDGNADQENVEEEEFVIPRSIREIYMISNRNRRNKKAGSPTPERGVTPTSEREQEELARAEAVLKERGDAVAGYFDDNIAASPGKRPRTKSGRESEESVPDSAVNVASKDDDLAFMKDIGWIKNKEEVEGLLKQRYGKNRGGDAANRAGSSGSADATADEQVAADEDAAAVAGGIHPSQQASNNPFFAGAALQGGLLAGLQQGVSKPEQRTRKSGSGKGKQNKSRLERPEKKEGRTHAYRKR